MSVYGALLDKFEVIRILVKQNNGFYNQTGSMVQRYMPEPCA